MSKDFDPSKNEINQQRHGMSLDRWSDLEIVAAMQDDRKDYGEIRYRAFGYIDGLACCLAFTLRDGKVRPISLRRAHAKEMKRHVPKD